MHKIFKFFNIWRFHTHVHVVVRCQTAVFTIIEQLHGSEELEFQKAGQKTPAIMHSYQVSGIGSGSKFLDIQERRVTQ